MAKRVLASGAILGAALAVGLLDSRPALADPELVVGCGGYTSIQAAVNAARKNAKIRVCPGTYNEQVTITKPLKITGDNGAIVMPSSMTVNALDVITGNPIAAAIVVTGTTDVTIERLTIDGTNNGTTDCTRILVGILYQNASGKIEDVAVKNFVNGCEFGHGILVQSGNGKSKVKVEDSSIHSYQKNGITGEQPGTDLRVKGSVVSGRGLLADVIQTGIQFCCGATGSIEENVVSNHLFVSCISLEDCLNSGFAVGIALSEAHGLRIAKNTVGKSQLGIFVVSSHDAKVEGNIVFGTDFFDGIFLLFSDDAKVETNTITDSGRAAVFVCGNNAKVTGNRINDATFGVWTLAGLRTVVEGNRFVNTPTPIFTGSNCFTGL